jgi:hypothetical protein
MEMLPIPGGSAVTTSSRPEPLPMRWAVILLAGLLFALLAGALTLAETSSWPATLLAGLAAAGVTITALHQMLGR